MKFVVKQVLVREREIQVDARSGAEAQEKAQKGFGMIIQEERRYRLLASEARRA